MSSRRADVDSVNGGAVHLGGCIQALDRSPDELEVRGPLDRHLFGERHAGGFVDEIPVVDFSAGGLMHNLPIARPARGRINIPAFCRSRHEESSRQRSSLPQRLPCRANRGRPTRRLHARKKWISVKLGVRRSVFQADLVQIPLQFLDEQHRDRGVIALTHLNIGHCQHDPPVTLDTNEGVRREAFSFGGGDAMVRERQGQAQHQAAAGGRPSMEKPAPRRSTSWPRREPVGGTRWDRVEDHGQPSFPIACAACLIASRMRG